MLKWLLFPLLALSSAAATPFELWAGKPADHWGKAFSIRSESGVVRVCGRTDTERLTISGTLGAPLGGMRLEWLDASLPVTGYRRSLDLATGIATTSFERGGIRITETVFPAAADGVLVVHLHADRPGALNFRIAVSGPVRSPVEIVDRRGLVTRGLRAWVLPFESDVESGENSLLVRGEGEALVLIATGTTGLADRYERLALKYDGRRTFPDLNKVWAGLLNARKQAED